MTGLALRLRCFIVCAGSSSPRSFSRLTSLSADAELRSRGVAFSVSLLDRAGFGGMTPHSQHQS